MSKIVKGITKFAGKLTGGLIGGGSDPAFNAVNRKIDKEAFKIKDADKFAEGAKTQEDKATARSDKSVGDRNNFISALQGQVDGTTPSLAEAQLKSSSERNLAQQLAAAQSQRGGSASSRQRNLARSQSQSGRELSQDAATARIQERNSAQQLLGTQISQEQQQSDALVQAYLGQGFSIQQAQQQAAADFEKQQTSQFLATQGINASQASAAAANDSSILGGIIGAGGAIGGKVATSDKRAKTKIKKTSSKQIGEALESMSNKGSKKNINETSKKGTSISLKDKKEEKGKDKKGEIISAAVKGFQKGAAKAKENSRGAINEGQSLFEQERAKISDKNAKKNIKEGFLDKLKSYTYEYKDEHKKNPLAGEGEYTSVMAQDLEKTEIGKNMVTQDQNGVKMVDYGKGYGAILAAQAHLNERLNEIEKSKKGKKTKKKKA